MRELHDVLNEGYASHSQAIDVRALEARVAARATKTARHRRAWRTAGAGAAGGVAVATVGLAAFAAPVHLRVSPAGSNPPGWCDLSTHPTPNVEAFGPARYLGRLYIDYDTGRAVWAGVDGVHEEVEPDSNGTITLELPGTEVVKDLRGAAAELPARQVAEDVFGNGTSAGSAYLEDPEGPHLGYEWTTVAPDSAPPSINVPMLAELHLAGIGLGGTALTPEIAGPDAVVEQVVTWTDGSTRTERIALEGMGSSLPYFNGVASVATKVSLPDGTTYTISSAYEPSKTFAAACGRVPGTGTGSTGG